jgi:hypothetical protein
VRGNKDIRYEILCADTRGFYASSKDGCSGYEDTPAINSIGEGMLPSCADDGKTNVESYAEETP